MIGNIEPPNPNIGNAVSYNEKKMDGVEGPRPSDTDESVRPIEDGHVLATRNVPEDGTLMGEFKRLKELNLRKATRAPMKNYTFHMSINPSDTDRVLSEEDAVKFIDEVMEGLGYQDQPYRIYKHTDIQRMHYHVVSTRAGQNGKKINDSFERFVLRETLKKLSQKYGFTLVLNEKELEEEERRQRKAEKSESKAQDLQGPVQPARQPSPSKKEQEKKKYPEKKNTPFVPSFSRKSSTPVTTQIADAFEDAMKWNFTTFEQLQGLLLRRYNVLIEIEKTSGGDHIVTHGTSAAGVPVTPPKSETALGIPMLQRIKDKCEDTKMSEKKEQKKRLELLALAAADVSESFDDFRAKMEQKGVYVVISWTEDGDPFGVTWLDKATKCAWKGSETNANLKWLKALAESKGWTITKNNYESLTEKRNAMPSRKNTIVKTMEPSQDTAPNTISNTQITKGNIIAALKKIRAGGHHQDGDKDAGRSRGRSIWDEALEAAERDERERRKNEGENKL